MPRPKRCRRICSEPINNVFYPSIDNGLEGISCICQPKTEPLHQFKNEPPTNDIKYGRWLICLVVNF